MTDRDSQTLCAPPPQEQRKVIIELTSRLVSAEALLASLQNAQQTQPGSQRRVDPVKRLTGRSSIDAAIVSTGEMIDQLRTAVSTARRMRSGEHAFSHAANS
jgi:hypothetical protein